MNVNVDHAGRNELIEDFDPLTAVQGARFPDGRGVQKVSRTEGGLTGWLNR